MSTETIGNVNITNVIVPHLPLHKYRPLARLLQNTDKPEHPVSMDPISSVVTSVRLPSGMDFTPIARQFAPNMGCSSLEERIEGRGIVNDLKDDVMSGLVQMSCSPVRVIVKVWLTSACAIEYPLICEDYRADSLEFLQPAAHSRRRRYGWGGEVTNSLSKLSLRRSKGLA